jgi:hypothetical protein
MAQIDDNTPLDELIRIGDDTYDARAPINVITHMTSPNVLLKSSTLVYCEHEAFQNEVKLLSERISSTVFIEDSQIVAPAANNFNYTNHRNYIAIQYTESDFPLDTILYVRITVKVLVEYVFSADDLDTRRRLVDVTYDGVVGAVDKDSRRVFLQLEGDGNSMGAVGSGAWKIGLPGVFEGSQPTTGDKQSMDDVGSVPQSVFIAAIVVLVLVILFCCCYGGYHVYSTMLASFSEKNLITEKDVSHQQPRSNAPAEHTIIYASPKAGIQRVG